MEIRFKDSRTDTVKTDLLVLPVYEKKIENPTVRAIDRNLKGKLREQIRKSKFIGTEGSTLHYATVGLIPAFHLLLNG